MIFGPPGDQVLVALPAGVAVGELVLVSRLELLGVPAQLVSYDDQM